MSALRTQGLRCLVIGILGVVAGFVANPEGLRLERTRRTVPTAGTVSGGASVPAVAARLDARAALEYHGQPDVIFLDARDGRDFARAHIAGAFPLVDREGRSLVAAIRPWLHTGARIVIYAGAPPDVRASLRSSELRNAGYPRVQVIEGGYAAWVRAGGPRREGWDADALLETGRALKR